MGSILPFVYGKILPINIDGFDRWYRCLPIHKMFLEGRERDIHYLEPNH
jgi:hypothetical protein